VGQSGTTTTSPAASVVAPRRRSDWWRGTTAPGSHGQLLDARTAEPGPAIAQPKSGQLPELTRRTTRRRPVTTTERRVGFDGTGQAQAAIMGIREVDKPGAKHIVCGLRTTSKRLL
jgi:hypothetical protein